MGRTGADGQGASERAPRRGGTSAGGGERSEAPDWVGEKQVARPQRAYGFSQGALVVDHGLKKGSFGE
jgi:hypothetical protein